MSDYFQGLIKELSELTEVKAIALGGSRATGRHDDQSDYDVYVYSKVEVPYDKRKAITDRYCEYMELNNTYYEMEDDGRLKNGIVIELIYRNIEDFKNQLSVHLEGHIAYGGYTTCFYANLLDCKILYDDSNLLEGLKVKYQKYPEALRNNIISKNRELLSGVIPSLDDQVIKASKRLDYPSINHRIAEYLASYFDILFAYNYVPHPGEKRMIDLAEILCLHIPANMRQDIECLIKTAGVDPASIPDKIKKVTTGIDQLLLMTI